MPQASLNSAAFQKTVDLPDGFAPGYDVVLNAGPSIMLRWDQVAPTTAARIQRNRPIPEESPLKAARSPRFGPGSCLAHRTGLRVVLFIDNEISILGDVFRRELWYPINVNIQGSLGSNNRSGSHGNPN